MDEKEVIREIVAVLEGLLSAIRTLAVVAVRTPFLNDQIRYLEERIEKLKARDG